ncbi:MAG: hypothetical protein GQ582_07935 [Methyloprofundus sp.]|nr:hypothetical protein [Methyloprofundus sp.]
MTAKKKDDVLLSAIGANDIVDAANFLHLNMIKKFSPQEWQRVLKLGWIDPLPNHGFMLKHEDQIVGVLCTIYSTQLVNNKVEQFCGPHTWCVLPDYRKKSIQLVLAAIKQKGFHFTMFTPNERALEIFSFLKFKPLGNHTISLLNLPTLSSNKVTLFDAEQGVSELSAQDAKCLTDHLPFSWMDFLVFKVDGKSGFIIYKKQKYKRLPTARILYISDKELFFNHWKYIRTHLCVQLGLVTSRIPDMFVKKSPSFVLARTPDQQRFYLSPTLSADNVEYIYSELLAMDLFDS